MDSDKVEVGQVWQEDGSLTQYTVSDIKANDYGQWYAVLMSQEGDRIGGPCTKNKDGSYSIIGWRSGWS